jgi:uncharacterized membrane protein HdeD (DUF308 family)
MNLYALVIGMATVAFIIFRFKQSKLEYTKWAYPLLLASFPVYYFAFAVYGNDFTALGKELLAGMVFFAFAFIAYKSQRALAAVLVGIGCILHAIYDASHNLLFTNAGTPDWWIEFCGSIDLILGVYLIYFALTMRSKAQNHDVQRIHAS